MKYRLKPKLVNIELSDENPTEFIIKDSERIITGDILDKEYIKVEPSFEHKECCGSCWYFQYEDCDGHGICSNTQEIKYCGDRCHFWEINDQNAIIFILDYLKNKIKNTDNKAYIEIESYINNITNYRFS